MRQARPTDAEELEELENSLFPDNSMNTHTLLNEMRYSKCLVEERDGKLVGYILARVMDDLVDILRVGILPEYRQQGIARELMKEFITGKATLLVRKGNDPAIKLYLKLGFKIVGHLESSWLMLKG